MLCHSLQWHGHPARKEVFNAVQAAAAQSAEDTVIDILQQWCSATDKNRSEQSSLARVKSTTLTDRATTIMNQTVWKYQHIIEKQSRQPNLLRFVGTEYLTDCLYHYEYVMSRNYPRSSTGKQHSCTKLTSWLLYHEHFPSERLARGQGCIPAFEILEQNEQAARTQSYLSVEP